MNKYFEITLTCTVGYCYNKTSPTMRGQKKKVSLLLNLSMYSITRNKTIRNSNTVAAMYFGVDATVKHTNAANRVT